MGRKIKYKTEQEKREAQLRWQREHYARNKKKICKKARDKYRKQQLNKIREVQRKHLYGE